MSSEDNNQAVATDTQVEETDSSNTISLSRDEYDKLQKDLGSLKREKKEWIKQTKETPEKTTPENNSDERYERLAFKAANINHEDDMKLAREKAEKWNMDIDQVLDDPDFQLSLERQQTERKNADASSDVKGDKSGGTSGAKEDPAYWLAKGKPPTADEVPDRKVRAKIVRAFMAEEKGVGKNPYYNGK